MNKISFSSKIALSLLFFVLGMGMFSSKVTAQHPILPKVDFVYIYCTNLTDSQKAHFQDATCIYRQKSYDSEDAAYTAYLSDNNTSNTSDQPASFGTGVSGLSGGILRGSNPAENSETALSNLEIIISRILGGLTTLSTIFFIIYFVLGTFGWITAGGDSSKINKARDEMIQGALGMIVVVVTYVLIGLVGNIIGLDVLNPAQQIRNVFLTEPPEIQQIDWDPGVTQLEPWTGN